jgi:hypothetical protein
MKTIPTLEDGAPDDNSGRNTIASELVQNLINNYRSNQMQVVNKELGITDAHAIWFDLPKLKKFIACIESEAQKVKPEVSEEDLGIRFYYAAYPKAEDWAIMESHPVEKEYAERHTLVMVPTLKKEGETGEMLNYDFTPFEGKSALAMAGKKSQPLQPETIAENHGTLSPPHNTNSELFP